jgi:hypothetical protein
MDARNPLDGFNLHGRDNCDCLICIGDPRLSAAVTEVLLYILRPFGAGEEQAQDLLWFMLNHAAAQEEGGDGEQNLAAEPHPGEEAAVPHPGEEAAVPHPGEEAAVQRRQVELDYPLVIDLTLPPTDVPEVVDLTGHDSKEELIVID